MEDFENDFADQLGRYLGRAGLTQQELASKIGVHRNTIVKWLNRSSRPEARGQVLRLADELVLAKEERKALIQAAGFPVERWPTEVWSVPQQRDMFFTGRDEILQILHQSLVPGSTAALTQAISGLGGIGKTHTALEYAYRFGNYYEAVLWLQADSSLAMASACMDVAYELGLPERDEQDLAKIVEAVKRWLRTHRHWLLILDNIEDLQLIAQIVPTNHQGCVLITTRLSDAEPLAQTQILPLMPEHEGVLFLLKRTKSLRLEDDLKHASSEQYHEAREIWQDMDGLPLALDQAGAYILETGCSFAAYREQFAKQRAKLLARRGKRFIGHEVSVATTFSLLFDRVKSEGPLAADILSLCSLLHNEAIPEEFFLAGAQKFGSLLTLSGEEWNEAVGILRDYSLVQRNINAKTLTMHRLVQAVLLDFMPEQEREQWLKRIITTMSQIFPNIMRQIFPSSIDDVQQEYTDTPQFLQGEPLIPHVLVSIKHVSSRAAVPQELAVSLAELLYDLACYLRVHPRPTEAISLYEQILRIQRPNDLPSIFLIRQGLSALYRTEGKFREAELHLLSILHAAEPIPEALSSWKAALLNELATCSHGQRRYDEAIQLFERSLLIEQWEASPTLHSAVTANNLAIAYKNQGRYKEAERLHQQVLRLREQILGPGHPDVAVALSSLAVLYLTQDRFSDAEPLFQRAMHIKEQSFRAAHPEIVSPMLNLANLYGSQRRHAEAEDLYRRGLLIWEQALGPNHPDVALMLRNLAATCEAQGKYEEAEQLCRRALNIYEQTDHQDASIARRLLATIRISRAKEKNEH